MNASLSAPPSGRSRVVAAKRMNTSLSIASRATVWSQRRHSRRAMRGCSRTHRLSRRAPRSGRSRIVSAERMNASRTPSVTSRHGLVAAASLSQSDAPMNASPRPCSLETRGLRRSEAFRGRVEHRRLHACFSRRPLSRGRHPLCRVLRSLCTATESRAVLSAPWVAVGAVKERTMTAAAQVARRAPAAGRARTSQTVRRGRAPRPLRQGRRDARRPARPAREAAAEHTASPARW